MKTELCNLWNIIIKIDNINSNEIYNMHSLRAPAHTGMHVACTAHTSLLITGVVYTTTSYVQENRTNAHNIHSVSYIQYSVGTYYGIIACVFTMYIVE